MTAPGRDRSSSVRVLVVDDEDSLRAVVARYLGSQGFHAEQAASVEEALPRIGEFDVFLSDIHMPGRDGHELLREVKHRDPKAIVVLMTGFASLESAVEAVREGAADYVLKPIADFRTLVLTLERALAQRELMVEVLALRKVNQLKDDFLSIVSHELRTPLSTFVASAEFLRDMAAEEKDENRARFADMALESCSHLRSILDDIFLLQDVQWGAAPPRQEAVQLEPLVQNAIEALRARAEAKDLRLEVADAIVDLPMARAGEYAAGRALWHLLDNAVKFNRPGGFVRVDGSHGEGVVRINVQDSGDGIEPGNARAIFGLFSQGEPCLTRIHEGAGVGLALVQAVAASCGGRVELVHSVRGAGSTFSLVLPKAD